jgi:CBS domain-containing protein
LEEEKLVGILSIGDLVNWFISAQKATIENLERFATGDYPSGY